MVCTTTAKTGGKHKTMRRKKLKPSVYYDPLSREKMMYRDLSGDLHIWPLNHRLVYLESNVPVAKIMISFEPYVVTDKMADECLEECAFSLAEAIAKELNQMKRH